jgi:hypothetical protein
LKKARGGFFLAVSVALLIVPAGATAQVTLGQLAPANPPARCVGPKFDVAPTVVASGTRYDVPADGVITSWSTNAASGDGQLLTFKVVRSVENRNLVVGHDGPRPLVPGVTNTFKTAIPVRAGDMLSLNRANDRTAPNACVFATGNAADSVTESAPEIDTADGLLWSNDRTVTGNRLNVQATFLAPPALTGIGTTRGSVTGGAPVVLSGANLAEVRSVTFGGLPAAGFTVDSESQITAMAPPSAAIASVPVVVTTVAGSATAPQGFAYEACRVPKLKGKTLKAARRLLASSGCRLAKLKRRFSGKATRVAKVVGQGSKPGALLAPGTAVKLTTLERPTDI